MIQLFHQPILRKLTSAAAACLFFVSFVADQAQAKTKDEIIIKGMSTQEQTPPPAIYQPAPLSPATIDAQSVNINMGKNEPIVDFPGETPVKPNQQSFKPGTAPEQPETPEMFLDPAIKKPYITSVSLTDGDIEPYLVNILGDHDINVIMDVSKKKNNEDGKCMISLQLKNVTLWAAIQQITSMCNLDLEIDNTNKIVNIHPPRPQSEEKLDMKTYVFKYLRVTSSQEDNYLRVTGSIVDKTAELKKTDLQNLVESMLSIRQRDHVNQATTAATNSNIDIGGPAGKIEHETNTSSVGISESNNSITIKARVSELSKIIKTLEGLDHPSPQVKIQAWIIETSSSVAKSIGVRWSGTFNCDNGVTWGGSRDIYDGATGAFNYPLQAIRQGIYPPTGKPDADGWAPPYTHETTMTPYSGDLYSLGIGITSDAGSLVAEMQALESNGDIHILSQPELTVQDNREATITSGRDLNVRISTTDKTEVKTIPAKLIATITPHVSPDNSLTMRVTLQNRYPDIKTIDNIPEVLERSIDTSLLVKNGETIVLGGLKVEKDNRSTDGVPYLKDIPLLGYIFRYQEDRKDADELLLIVRPTIISTHTQNNQVSSHPATELNHAGIK